MSASIEILKKTGKFPVVIVSIIPESLEKTVKVLQKLNSMGNVVPEIRYDLIKNTSMEDRIHILDILNRSFSNMITTFREKNMEKAAIFYSQALLKKGNIIDVDSSLIGKIGIELPRDRTLVSFHITDKTPVMDIIEGVFHEGFRAVKVAIRTQSEGSFLGLCRDISTIRTEKNILSLIPMGGESSIYRLISSLTVSDFTYTKYETETGEGQLNYEIMLKIINLLHK